MKYNEWRDELKNNLLSVSESERAKVLDYYAEAYADRREAGFSENEIIQEFGAPFDAAQRILADVPAPTPAPTPAPAPEAEKTVEKPAPTPAPVFMPQTAAATTATAVKKKSNLWWIIPLVCVAALIALTFFVILPVKYACTTFRRLSTITRTSYTAEEDYTAIRIETERCSVRTEFYDGDKITVDYPVIKGYEWSISNADGDGLLTICSNLPSNYLIFFGTINIPNAVIKLPSNLLFDVEIVTDAGSVTLADGNYNNLIVDINAGSFEAGMIICESINCKIDAGSFYADNITCNDMRCDIDAGEIDIDELTCNVLTATVNMGSLEIEMTGAKSEYNITASCNMGSSNLNNQTVDSDKRIDVSVNMGSLEITFDN